MFRNKIIKEYLISRGKRVLDEATVKENLSDVYEGISGEDDLSQKVDSLIQDLDEAEDIKTEDAEEEDEVEVIEEDKSDDFRLPAADID